MTLFIPSCDSVSSEGTNVPKKRKNAGSADDVNVNSETPKKKNNSKSAKVQSTLMAYFNKQKWWLSLYLKVLDTLILIKGDI